MSEIIEKFKRVRIICFVASLLICLCSGFGYSWSVLQTPFVQEHGWSVSSVALAYTLTVMLSSLTPIVFNKLINKMSVKQTILLGGVLLSAGLVLVQFSVSVTHLYLTYSLLTGVGTGFIYPTMMSYAVKLFPDKKSVASGCMAAAYGSGSVIWAPVTVRIMTHSSLSVALLILGVIFFIAVTTAGFFLKPIPEGFVELMEGSAPSTEYVSVLGKKTPDRKRGQIIRTVIFYAMILAFTAGTTSGMMIISQASPILQQALGCSAAAAAVFVSVFAVCNTAGRLIWGLVAQKIGVYNVLLLLLAISTLFMLLLSITPGVVLIVIAMALVASCYGGLATVITPMTSDMFGTKYLSENYGLMYMVFGLGALVGPRVAIACNAASGGKSYAQAFLLAALISVGGILLALYLKKINANNIKLVSNR